MRIFFTADTHFFHRSIIKHCQRPFHSPEEMNRAIVSIWNRQVAKDDCVYHLGDVSFGGLSETYRLLAELNGKICLIAGNHDDEIVSDPYLQERFLWIKPYHEMKLDKKELILCHYPIVQWRNAQRGAWHLYGHTHGSLTVKGAALDVGIDAHPAFRLWSWEEIKNKLCKRRSLPYPAKPHYPKRTFTTNWEIIDISNEHTEN